MPTSLVCSSTGPSALLSTKGFPPWSIWCRQVWRQVLKKQREMVVWSVFCFHFYVCVPLRFDDFRGAEAPGGLALSTQQVLGSLHVVRQPGYESSDWRSHQQRRGAHSYSHCRSSCVSVCRPKEPEQLHFVAILVLKYLVLLFFLCSGVE